MPLLRADGDALVRGRRVNELRRLGTRGRTETEEKLNVDSSQHHDPHHHLQAGAMGVTSIVFLVVATASPLAAMVAVLPVGIGFGDGIGAPGAILLAALVLTCFAFGYAAMSRHITNAGAFFAYVTEGLGPRFGMAAGFVAMLAYNTLVIYVVALVGYFGEQTFLSELGWHISWEFFSCGFLLLALGLGILGVELSALVLGFFLALETGLLLAIDVATLITQGFSAFTLSVFNPTEIFGGPAAGLGLMFAFTTYIGFEGTAIFGEEAKDPHRTVSRATLVAVAFIGLVYTITAWSLIAANGGSSAAALAAENPGIFTFAAAETTLGVWATHAMSWLILTSFFAITVAIHNMASRYFFAFGREGVLPRQLGLTHPRFRTPYVAASVQAVLVAVVVAIYALAGADPYLNLGSQMAGIGTLGVIVLELAVCAAIVVFFRRRGDRRWWTTLVAPVAAAVGLGVATVLIIENYASLTGSSSTIVNNLPWLLLVFAVVGFIVGTVRPLRRPVNVFDDPTDAEATSVAQEEVAGV